MAPWMWRGEQRGREGTVKFSVSNGKCVYMYRPRKQRLVRFFQIVRLSVDFTVHFTVYICLFDRHRSPNSWASILV